MNISTRVKKMGGYMLTGAGIGAAAVMCGWFSIPIAAAIGAGGILLSSASEGIANENESADFDRENLANNENEQKEASANRIIGTHIGLAVPDNRPIVRARLLCNELSYWLGVIDGNGLQE